MTKKEQEDAPEQVEMTADEVQAQETPSTEENNEEPIEEMDELTKLQEENKELNDKFLRLYSEFDNFRKRTQKEKLELYKTAGEDVIVSVLPVIDDLERALKAMTDTETIENIRQGITLINQKIVNALTQQGLKPIESAIGKDFDINRHEAITRIPAPEKKLKGKVIDEVEKGYVLNDKVIRYTKVVIGE